MTPWPEITIDAACSRIIDYRGKTPIKAASGIRLVTAKVVKGGRINEEPAEFLAEDYYDEWMRRGLPELHDTVLTTEAPLGEVGLIRTSGKIGLGQRIILLRPDPAKMDKRFLHLVLQTELVQSRLQARATGTTVLGIKQSELRRVELPCPPLETQRRIAAILGAYDDLIEVNRRRVAVLEEMARGLFEEWFVRFRFPGHEAVPILDTPDGPLPEGWRCGTLGDFLEERRDKASPGAHLADRRYVPIECIGRRTLALSEHQSWQNAQSSLQLFERGDLLFGAMRAYFHKVVPAPFAGITRTTCFVLRPRSPASAAFALLALFQDSTVAYAAAKSSGSTIPYAKWSGVLEKMAVPCPEDGLIASFNGIVWPMVEQIMNFAETNEKLSTSRDLLLPRLISGQLTVDSAERELEAAA